MSVWMVAHSDIGRKTSNQDGVLLLRGELQGEEAWLAVLCDGLGGLQKGELASATVLQAFRDWFQKEAPRRLQTEAGWVSIADRWRDLLQQLNERIGAYGRAHDLILGTTCTALLGFRGRYVLIHVGDTRIYHLAEELTQWTTDHTFVAREIRRGAMSAEQARRDRRRSTLLQCVGASKTLRPEVKQGSLRPGNYLLCSDGFRNEVSPEELMRAFSPRQCATKAEWQKQACSWVEIVKSRGERDNISLALVGVE